MRMQKRDGKRVEIISFSSGHYRAYPEIGRFARFVTAFEPVFRASVL